MKVAIVAPVHIQPSKNWVRTLQEEARIHGAHAIIVDDSDGKVDLPWKDGVGGEVYTYAKQREAMGPELYTLFTQFHKSSSCKAFGLWKAYQDGFDVVIVIDSDCIIPVGYFVDTHLKHLETPGDGWDNPLIGTGLYSRGFPYSERGIEKWAHMGLWSNELDLYGKDRVEFNGYALPKEPMKIICNSTGAHFPLSGMNVSFKREAIPFMLFLPNFEFKGKRFIRHDDIWGGYIFQKIAHQRGKSLSYGAPLVFHDTIVDEREDAKAEEPMLEYEDDFRALIDNSVVFQGRGSGNMSGPEVFSWLARELDTTMVFAGLADAMLFWSRAFE